MEKITVDAKKLNKLLHDIKRMHRIIEALSRELLDMIKDE